MAATTKTVTGNIGNLSDAAITGAELLFDLDPAYVIVDGSIIVGVINGGTKGIPVTADPDTGDFTVNIVAVDNPLWTISVSLTGAGIETPILISIQPPPAAGSGDVLFESLIVAGSAGTAPVIVNSIRGASDYDNGTAPTDGQAPLWDAAESKFKPGTVSGGSGTGLPDGGTAGQALTKNSGTNGDAGWSTITADTVGALTQTAADGRYLQDSDGSKANLVNNSEPVIYRNETTGVYPLRNTVTSDLTKPVKWSGTVSAAIGSGYAVDGVDFQRVVPA